MMETQDLKSLMAHFHQEKTIVSPPTDSQSQPHDKVPEHSHAVPPIESSHSIIVGTSETSVDGSPVREEGEIHKKLIHLANKEPLNGIYPLSCTLSPPTHLTLMPP